VTPGGLSLAGSWALRRADRALPVTVATAVTAFALGAALLLTSAVRNESLRALDLAPDITLTRLRGGLPRPVLTSAAQRLSARPGVLRVTPRVWGFVPLEGSATVITVVAAETPLPPGPALWRGRLPTGGERGWVVLGAGLARVFDLRVGDALSARGVALRVIGVFRDEVAPRTADVALCAPPDARALLGLEADEATDLALELQTPDARPGVLRAAGELLPDARALTRDDQRRAVTLTWGRRGGVALLALIPALIAVLALALQRAVGADPVARRELATLRALGWSVAEATELEAVAGVLPSALAAGAGVLGAYAYVFPMGAPGLRDVLLGPSAALPLSQLAPVGGLADVTLTLALVLLPQAAAALLGAWRVASADPLHALTR
jgi:lipoprotein-releasing system permease protein